jgi:hypothetical protein
MKEKLTLQVVVSGLTFSVSSYVEIRELQDQTVVEFTTEGKTVTVQFDGARKAARKLARLLGCIPETTCSYHQMTCVDCQGRIKEANEHEV